MDLNEDIKEILGISATFDIKVETLASTLLAQADGALKDFNLDQIVVAAKGNARRRVGGDVEEVKRKYYDHEVALMILANRKGLFDTLPQGLFLRLDEDYEDAKARTRAITQQIKEARKFFLPFEQAIYHARIEADQIEQKYTETFPEFIHKIWGFPEFEDCLSDRQKFLLCYLIPEAYRVVGDWKLTELIFEAVLQKPVSIEFIPPLELEIPNSDVPACEMRLGDNAIVGDAFRDDMPAMKVIVKGITYLDLIDYLPNGNGIKLLEQLLYSYFIPLDVPIVTSIVVTEDTLGCTLGNDFLGYNTELQLTEDN